MQRRFLALALYSVAACASAQTIPDPASEWKELDAPPPPPLHTQGLVPVDVLRTGALRFGVDPASITVGADRVVRYVVVATSSSGAVNGIYEGIRCDAGEVKVYARHNPDSGWVPTRDAEWQNIFTTPNNSHSLAIARSGACMDKAPNGSAVQILQDLRAPVDRRFERGGANR
jgi:hypothetical protein